MKKRRYLLLLGLLGGALVLLAPFLLPADAYIPQLERLGTERFGADVRVGAARATLLPTPRLRLSDVTVGKEVKVDGVTIVPALSTLFSADKRISLLVIERPVTTIVGLKTLSSSFKDTANSQTPPVNIREVRVERANLLLPQMALPSLDVEIFLQVDNTLESAKIEARDASLRIDLLPEGETQLIAVTAYGWRLPTDPPLVLDQLDSVMLLSARKLDIQSLDAELYGGQLSASAMLDWQKDWELAGQFKLADVEVAEPIASLGLATRLSGSLQGNGSFKTTATQPERLLDHLFANLQFEIRHGVLRGVDLLKAARLSPIKDAEADGETRFDMLAGLLQVSGRQYQVRDINIASGLLKASGSVKLKPDRKLDGLITVEVKNSAGLVAVPLRVSGTPAQPYVVPDKAALAGAAVGTAILGPGVGTGLGIQAAERARQLFGNN